MKDWFVKARQNWDAILAFFLAYMAIAVMLGPGYYFLVLYVVGTLYIVRVALRR